MPLFQKTILQKHLRTLNAESLEQQWKIFTGHFHNPTIQRNIRHSKEEQYQEGFVEDLFVRVLGYVKNPAPDYNFITEQKNQGDAKKADGAILIDGNVRAVVELKGTNTTDLGNIEGQVFGYKNRQSGCNYVIVSNFEKLRFYIENAVEHLEFNLFELTRDEFALLWLCLSYESISTDLPLRLKNESISAENEITKELYHDYSVFRRELFNDLIDKNPDIDKLLLFKKTQKLLDRFLFIFFAEDRLLLPVNLIKKIISEWEKLREMRVNHSLYERFKLYFNDLDTGNSKQEIFAYNGGLFQPDEILDNLDLDDQLLYEHTHRLSTYDFESEVDVNILGHIFENSLNEIEELENQVIRHQEEGVPLQVTKTSKRKKDGVFYTPKYITKYIVDNTLGKLCAEKKEELEISDEFYLNAKRRSQSRLDNLRKYRDWLLQLSICDPACGSGAFLNQALDFLIAEHRYVDELSAKYNNDPLVLSDIEHSILENNLYGVDINEESVHIAKLSLWLRTAQRNRKLNDLNQNLKCGNSLIDDPEIAGDRAFDWQKEFPQVFAKGGFDVVIGNPPYGIFIETNLKAYFEEFFPLTTYKTNLYILFIERMLQIFENGVINFIIPKSLLYNSYFGKIREALLTKTEINEIYTITEKVFEDAEVGGSLLIKFNIKPNPNLKNIVRLVQADKIKNFVTGVSLIENNVEQNFFLDIPDYEISVISSESQSILKKLHSFKRVKDFYSLRNGLNPGNIKHILICDKKESVYHKPIIWGKDISKYNISWSGQYINYNSEIGRGISLNEIKTKKGMNKQTRIDFALRSPDLFENKKIVIRKTGDSLIGSIDNDKYYFDTLVHGIYLTNENYSLEALLAVLNSKPATIFYRLLHDIKGKVFAKISLSNLGSFPIPTELKDYSQGLSKKAEQMLALNKEQNVVLDKFRSYFSGQYNLSRLSRKLENWSELEFSEFINELNKAIKKEKERPLSKKDAFEWMDLFEENKRQAEILQEKIQSTDQEIDRMVYELYGLTEEEIEVVEKS